MILSISIHAIGVLEPSKNTPKIHLTMYMIEDTLRKIDESYSNENCPQDPKSAFRGTAQASVFIIVLTIETDPSLRFYKPDLTKSQNPICCRNVLWEIKKCDELELHKLASKIAPSRYSKVENSNLAASSLLTFSNNTIRLPTSWVWIYFTIENSCLVQEHFSVSLATVTSICSSSSVRTSGYICGNLTAFSIL